MRALLTSVRNAGYFAGVTARARLSIPLCRQAGCLPCITVVFICIGLTACAPQKKEPAGPQDASLPEFQTELLSQAFELATLIPDHPHIKDKSRAQQKVVAACLELDLPRRALTYIEQIGNWRRGLGYADYAFYCVEHGETNGVAGLLEQAETISRTATQEWRRDSIKTRVAQTRVLLQQSPSAEPFSFETVAAVSGKVEQVSATFCSDENLDEQLERLDTMVATKNYDLVNNSLQAYAELYNRFYDQPDIRGGMEEKIRVSWDQTPWFVRIDILLKLSGISLEHDDVETALRLVDDARELVTGADWPVQYEVMLSANVADVRSRCGDIERAVSELDQALELFSQKTEMIVNIDRADTLIPVAEAFVTAGKPARALAVYSQAVEAAVLNPNSRPQAEDLSAICVSMALHNLEPNQNLWSRMKELQSNLGDPW